ncbi:hypothetical protein NDI52_33140 [Leptolyngbya sp. PL-A3]|uniref:hypothetical protein n=1 Tax=Leptolyngbya sp. PL-A3 TaxID=2933911 RepID=UPI0032971E03
MENQTREDECTQAIAPRFEFLNQLIYLTSGCTAALGLVAGLLFGNAGVAITGVGSAGLSLYALAPSRKQVAQTSATLLINHDEQWQQTLSTLTHQAQEQIHLLTVEHQTLLINHSALGQKLRETQSHLSSKLAQTHSDLAHRQQQIEALNAELNRLQQEKRSLEQTLSAQLQQTQDALQEAQSRLAQNRYDLAVHLDAIEGQILDIWNPLYRGLLAICDRFDPARPVPDLEYAGKPAHLSESEKRQWHHYRASLNAYDADLRKRIGGMSEDCSSHDEAYAFFLKLLEELTSNYCKLWANVRDLEIGSTHDAEKRAIYSEFENLRNEYVSDASQWVEKSSTVEEGFCFIEESFKSELASLQQRIVEAEHLIEHLQAPRRFRGETNIDKAGNRIIEHFATSGIILDAIESVKIPGGFQLRFKVDRNPDSTRLTESEFDKHCDHLGLWGLSQRLLDFSLDTRNFLLSVNLYSLSKSLPIAAIWDGLKGSVTPAIP